MSEQLVLSLKGLSKRFGSVLANDAVDIDLFRGEVLALLGENGAGKTTLMNMLFGHYLPDSGRIDVADETGHMHPLALGHPQAALDAGIGMVHQHFTLAENLTALDNILLGSERLFALRRNRKAPRAKIREIMERSGLTVALDEPVGQMSVGERQRVEILKALYRDARILVLDEPTAVLTPQEADTLFENIGTMTKSGLSVIFISHKLREVLAFSSRIAVLRHGRNVGELITADANEAKIARLMVGADMPSPQRDPIETGPPVLDMSDVSVSGQSARDSLKTVNLRVHAHEIVGVAGVSGNGQAALARLLSGLVHPSTGQVKINGETIRQPTPRTMIQAGVGRIPEDRHREGVVGAMTVADNLIIEQLDSEAVQSHGFLRQKSIHSQAERLCAQYDIRGPGAATPARLLSGGNLQKVILARIFETQPNLILANQPTRGLDMGAAGEVGRRLIQARTRGAGVLLISEDLDEILSLADRIVVIHDGHLFPTETADRQSIGLMMAGQAA